VPRGPAQRPGVPRLSEVALGGGGRAARRAGAGPGELAPARQAPRPRRHVRAPRLAAAGRVRRAARRGRAAHPAPTSGAGGAAALSRPSTTSLAAAAYDLALPESGTLAQRIDRALRLQPIIEQQAAKHEPDWRQLDERVAALEAATDPVVKGFGDFLRRDAVAAVRLTDEGFEGFPQLKQNAGLAMQVLESLRTIPPTEIDAVRFNDEVVRDLSPSDVEAAHVRRWLSQRPQYVVRRDDIARAVDELQRRYDATAGEVAKSAPDPAEAAAFKVDQEAVEAAVRELRQRKFIERDVTEGRLRERVAEIGGQIDLLKRYYHAEDAADWLDNLAGVATTSERIKTRWQAWVDTLRSDLSAMAEDRELFTASKARTDKLRDALTEMELNVPQPPEGLSEAFAKAARERREQRIGDLIGAVDAADPVLPPELLRKAVAETAAWMDDLKSLSADFPVRKRLLTVEDRPDAKWRERRAFWADPVVQRLIGKDVERIDRLQKLSRASRQELVAAATADGLRPEVNVAAWQLLGEKGFAPHWPATADELEAEAALRARVAAEAERLDEAERKPLAEALAREGPRRWRRFVEAADAEPLLLAAVKRADAFRIDHVVLGDMSPAARFNFWLCAANLAVRDDRARQRMKMDLNKVVDNLRVAAEQLGRRSPPRAEVLKKLERLAVPDPFANRGELPDVFQLSERGLDRPLEFRRVEPKDGSRPFYIGTREVTVAQFAGALEGAELWGEARKLPGPTAPPPPTPAAARGRGSGSGTPTRRPRAWAPRSSG
jgi:hypothetical protein